jgi:outer membrane protein OmpA-like peptidoglycan-associated protein
MIYRLLFIFIFLLLLGCSKTTVVLLDSGKSQNAIIISTDKGSTKLDRVGTFVDLNNNINEIKTMSKEEINSRFSKVLAVSPTKPIRYMLYFKSNSIELTDDSQKKLTDIVKSMEIRSPCKVDIIGHTDTIDSYDKNIEVSLQRAKYVESLIKERDIKLVSLTIKGYGEEDLLIETADNISEAENRNVEVFIK